MPPWINDASINSGTFSGNGAIAESIVPAYRRLLVFMEQEYLPACRGSIAASALPNGREFIVLGILALAVLLVGLWPAPLVDMMSVTVRELLVHVGQTKLAGL